MITQSDLSLRRETILVPTKLLDTLQEQSVELDYVLPDYFPDFFRLLSCTAEPTITHWELRDGALCLSLSVKITVWYLAEGAPLIQVMTQKLEYQKQIPWQAEQTPDEVQLSIVPTTSYINCRAVNSRRMDIRGAVRITVQAIGMIPRQVLADACGLYTHCRKEPVRFVSGVLRQSKRCTLSEDFSIPAAQPPLLSILREEIRVQTTETRCIAGKLVVKGEVLLSLLYTAKEGVESLQCALPLSQIVETDGMEDDMPCTVRATPTEHLITTEADGIGDIRKLHLDVQLQLTCEALRATSAELVTDLYSTVHPISLTREELPLLTMPQPVQEHLHTKITLTQPDSVIPKVYAAWSTPKDMALQNGEDGTLMLMGSLQCCVLAADAEGTPMLLEQTESIALPCPTLADCSENLLPEVTVQSCMYTLSAADAVTLQIELLLQGSRMQQTGYPLLTDAMVDAENRLPSSGEYALRLYFAQAEESLWEIAKRYHTAASAIMEENDCRDEILTQPQMLLIPIVQ